MRDKAQRSFEAALAQDTHPTKLRFSHPMKQVLTDDPKLDPELQIQIGEQLRSYYAELMSEPVPDRLVELLNRLDRKH